MKMNACRITDLALVLGKQLVRKKIVLKEVGIRPGEKLHEVLVSRAEAPHTYRYSDRYFVILPSHSSSELIERYKKYAPVTFERYQSNDDLMNEAEIMQLLKRGGMLK
jgi:UDP-N-acetylglucosamine 4,6-dehydratase